MYWKTKDGQKILYSDLTEKHIQNIVNMFVRSSQKQGIIPEVWERFHDIMDEAETRGINVDYRRYLPEIYGFKSGLLRFPDFSIELSLYKHIYSISSSNQIAVLKEFVEGDISNFPEDKHIFYLPEIYSVAIDVSLKRWGFLCEAMGDGFPHHGLGYAWGLG